jgi:Raf kinase inhibitor-like YbhB/YbcL family protein
MAFVVSDMQLTSSAFSKGQPIPAKHTNDGENVSPPLAWTDPPGGTRSYAVICHDPDAPLVSPGTYGYVHWVLYNLPGSTTSLAEGTDAGTSGANDAGATGWTGCAPPPGHGTHHYFFWVFALDRELDLEPGLTLWELLGRIEPHIIGMNRLVGTYKRS